MDKKLLAPILLLATALTLGIALAHVTTFFPISLSINPQNATVIFEPGSNANAVDAGGPISVETGTSNTTLSITIHPTFETTYYQNISIIRNKSSNAVTINLTVVQPLDATQWPTGSKAYLLLFDSSTTSRVYDFTDFATGFVNVTNAVRALDLTQEDSVTVTLDGNDFYQVDLLIYIPDTTNLTVPSQNVVVALQTTS